MRFFISCMTVAMGVRRLPGAGASLEDLVGSLRAGVLSSSLRAGALSSMLQNDASSSWLGNESYHAISGLVADLTGVVEGEHNTDQTLVHGQMNQWGKWQLYSEFSLGVAGDAENDLRSKLEVEKAKAKFFHEQILAFSKLVEAVMEDCLEYQVLESFSSSLVDGKIMYKIVSPDDHEAVLVVDAADHLANVNASRDSCDAQKLAIEGFWSEGDENAYTLAIEARENVVTSFDHRRAVICENSAPCADSAVGGLQDALRQTCSSKGIVDAKQALIDSANNTFSLADRNYERDALQTVKCLLDKLQGYTNGDFTGTQVTALVESCENEHFNPLTMLYTETTDTAVTNTDVDCLTQGGSPRNYENVKDAMPPLECGNDFSLVIGSADEIGYIQGVISDSFVGSVEKFAPALSLVPDADGCDWYCTKMIPVPTDCLDVLKDMTHLHCTDTVKRAKAAETEVPVFSSYTKRLLNSRQVKIVEQEVTLDDCV